MFSYSYKELAEGFEKKIEPLILSIDLYQKLYARGKNPDPYSGIKKRSRQAAERSLPAIEKVVDSFTGFDRLRASLAASIAGNLIDYNTAYHKPDLEVLVDIFHSIQSQGFSPDDSEPLWKRLNSRKGHIVFLADNAGETHFDIPLLRLFKMLGWRTTYVVKGRAMINDATREDIAGSDIENLAEVADTGGWAHGVPRKWVSPEFISLVKSADLVISKGQANVESFPDFQKEFHIETYYVIRAKCPHIAAVLGTAVGDNVVLRRQ